jgi:hypothetical protein
MITAPLIVLYSIRLICTLRAEQLIQGHQNFEYYYQNNAANTTTAKYHEAVLTLYFLASAEAMRILKNHGVVIIKCQDEVCANKQRLTHVEINHLSGLGFLCEDLFIVIRLNKPGVSRIIRQRHARKKSLLLSDV